MWKSVSIETPRSVEIVTIISTISLASRRDTIVIPRVVLSVRYVPAATFSGSTESEVVRVTTTTTRSFLIPVIAHNMKGFDAHLILKGYERDVAQRGSQINVIP